MTWSSLWPHFFHVLRRINLIVSYSVFAQTDSTRSLFFLFGEQSKHHCNAKPSSFIKPEETPEINRLPYTVIEKKKYLKKVKNVKFNLPSFLLLPLDCMIGYSCSLFKEVEYFREFECKNLTYWYYSSNVTSESDIVQPWVVTAGIFHSTAVIKLFLNAGKLDEWKHLKILMCLHIVDPYLLWLKAR